MVWKKSLPISTVSAIEASLFQNDSEIVFSPIRIVVQYPVDRTARTGNPLKVPPHVRRNIPVPIERSIAETDTQDLRLRVVARCHRARAWRVDRGRRLVREKNTVMPAPGERQGLSLDDVDVPASLRARVLA